MAGGGNSVSLWSSLVTKGTKPSQRKLLVVLFIAFAFEIVHVR